MLALRTKIDTSLLVYKGKQSVQFRLNYQQLDGSLLHFDWMYEKANIITFYQSGEK